MPVFRADYTDTRVGCLSGKLAGEGFIGYEDVDAVKIAEGIGQAPLDFGGIHEHDDRCGFAGDIFLQLALGVVAAGEAGAGGQAGGGDSRGEKDGASTDAKDIAQGVKSLYWTHSGGEIKAGAQMVVYGVKA